MASKALIEDFATALDEELDAMTYTQKGPDGHVDLVDGTCYTPELARDLIHNLRKRGWKVMRAYR